MNYKETVEYLYSLLPNYQNQGATALNYKLDKVSEFLEELGNPHHKFKSIHVGGTNGKGTTSYILASVLSESGYNVGLYTSPHLKSFRERIKVNGQETEEDYIVQFVQQHNDLIQSLKPSFFEITVVMAFNYFAQREVDFAVIEVGLGGRFDATNVISPELSVITNISLDHQEYLGDTVSKIAFEKAGIIKPNKPVVIGEYNELSFPVFQQLALENNSKLIRGFETELPKELVSEWDVDYVLLNKRTAFTALEVLKSTVSVNYAALENGFLNYEKLWGLKGRWQKLGTDPLMVCDTGHNEGGVQLLNNRLRNLTYQDLYIVWGMVEEKDVGKVLSLLPKDAHYVFTQANNPRAMKAEFLFDKAKTRGLNGELVPNVNEAISLVKKKASEDDFILVGGSTFVVAEIEGL